MNEFIDKCVIQQLRCHTETITCLKLNDKAFMEREREIAIAHLSKTVDRDELTRCHLKYLKSVKTKMLFYIKFMRLSEEERKIFILSVTLYAKEINLYNIIMNSYVSLENLTKLGDTGNIAYDDLQSYNDEEINILLSLLEGNPGSPLAPF